MTSFIGFENLDSVSYETIRGEETRCYFCKNLCIRTFIDLKVGPEKKRYIIATCDKGLAESREELQKLLRERNKEKSLYPNFVEEANRLLFRSYSPEKVLREGLRNLFRKKKIKALQESVVGLPRVLNMYSLAPFFRTFFEALGVKKVVFSDYTSEELYRRGSKRGSIDPCYPSKVAIAHVHNLLFEKKGVNLVFFPCIRTLPPEIERAEGHWACPTVSATPEVVKAAFTKERDEFRERGVLYLNPVLDFGDEELLTRQLHRVFGPLWGITLQECRDAVREGKRALREYRESLQERAKEVLERLERERRVGVVLLGRPYHNDPGLNHEIPDEINKRGYPVFTIDSLPRDEETLLKVFGKDLREGRISSPMEIRDLWKKCYSENSSIKVWAARFAARHPNLAAVDLSSFRCGHDAPIYSLIEEILAQTDTPYFTFHELDENRPTGSIKLRVETIDYFLKRYEEEVLRREEVML